MSTTRDGDNARRMQSSGLIWIGAALFAATAFIALLFLASPERVHAVEHASATAAVDGRPVAALATGATTPRELAPGNFQ